MRHPYCYHTQTANESTNRPWSDAAGSIIWQVSLWETAWRRALKVCFAHRALPFALVRYEDLAIHTSEIMVRIGNVFRLSLSGWASEIMRHGRRLVIREHGAVNPSFLWSCKSWTPTTTAWQTFQHYVDATHVEALKLAFGYNMSDSDFSSFARSFDFSRELLVHRQLSSQSVAGERAKIIYNWLGHSQTNYSL